jgi:hypothetical protein
LGAAGNEEKVPLEIHIMSKCPDARDCLRELIVPTMVQVSEKVDLTMSFIGRYIYPSPVTRESCLMSLQHRPKF